MLQNIPSLLRAYTIMCQSDSQSDKGFVLDKLLSPSEAPMAATEGLPGSAT